MESIVLKYIKGTGAGFSQTTSASAAENLLLVAIYQGLLKNHKPCAVGIPSLRNHFNISIRRDEAVT